MMMQQQSQQAAQPEKKPYAKPELQHVYLRPEEAVLGSCKTTGVSGPGGAGDGTPAGPCSSLGS
jgi:hypothetical protein